MKSQILMNDFSREYRLIGKQVMRAIDSVLRGGHFVLGPNVAGFEKEFSSYIGAPYAIGVANGLDALEIALLGLGVTKGDEVITVANTDIATALAIVSVGATPVFVDTDAFYHMDPSHVERAITSRTKAILPVHLYGQPCDMERLVAIARKHGVFLVEDACQAHGAMFRGKMAGTFGDAGCFSFYPTKNLGAYGDAGLIVTHSKRLYDRCVMLRNRGQSKKYVYPIRGKNSRLDELQAAILRVKLGRLSDFNRKRSRIAERYLFRLKDEQHIILPHIREGALHVFHLFVIQAQRRNLLQKHLTKHGVSTLVHYPVPIHRQKSFLRYENTRLPHTEKQASAILSLPVHPHLTLQEVDRVCDLIRGFYRRKWERPIGSV